MRQPNEESPPETAMSRPAAGVRPSDRAREWLDWFGVTRLVTSAIAVAVVCVGGWWLLRAPAPPPESSLPMASGASVPSGTLVTLPVPPSPSTVAGPDPLHDGAGASVVVHVAGSVEAPGVFELPVGSRVADAIERAGGPTDEAEPDALNLAQAVVDGSRVYVPAAGEEVSDIVVDVASDTSSSLPVGPIDVNRAAAIDLETLPGVGPATAAAIVTERDRGGPFRTVADLERVPGIGPAKLGALEGLVTT